MTNVRPFRFSGLPRVTREQAAVHESLAAYLSFRPYDPAFAKELEGELERYLKAPCNLSSFSIKTISRKYLEDIIPAVGCLLVVGAAPTEHKIIVELDSGLAGLATRLR